MAGKKWHKVLYEKYDVPDNYVDDSFLTEMKKNLYLRSYKYRTLVITTGRISQQMNSVLVFVISFVYLQGTHISAISLTLFTAAAMLLSFLFSSWYPSDSRDMKAVVVFCLASFALSPVLMSLTNEISTDTIYAMVSLMFLVHLYTFDYSDCPSDMSGATSFNIIIFATVCLASRLDSIISAFSLIFFSILMFAVVPKARQRVRSYSLIYTDCFITCSFFVISLGLLATNSLTLAVLHVLMFIFITFACPYLLLCLQPLKNNIHGPWDEAVVHKSVS